MKDNFTCFFSTKAIVLLLGLVCFLSEPIWSQAPNQTAYLSWNKAVSCQILEFDPDRLVLTNFENASCLRVCEYSLVTYTLNNLSAATPITWTVGGGVVQSTTSNSATVQWNNQQNGYLSFNYPTAAGIVTKTLCIEKVKLPAASFVVNNDPQLDVMQIQSCLNQSVYFENTSTANGGSQIMNYFWDFGDGGISYEQSPNYQYQNPGNYPVYLTVTNSCGCASTYEGYVFVSERKSFEISCPTVICEDGMGVYSLPHDIASECQGLWSVDGGTIIDDTPGSIQIQWNQVDSSGFGYVTFTPGNCNVECTEPTTIKVPVIQTNGVIQGANTICSGKQLSYSLPQWPSTDIIWSIQDAGGGLLVDVVPTDQRNEVVLNVLSGSGTFTLVAQYQNTLLGCGGSAELQITVAPQLLINEVSTLCTGTNHTFTNSEGISVNWQLYKNTSLIASATGTTFSYTFTQSGNYEIKASTANYCSTARSFTVIDKPIIPAGILGDTEVCPQMAYTYQVVNPDNNLVYIWNISNGTFVGSNQGEQVQVVFNGNFPASVKVRARNPLFDICNSDELTLLVQPLPLSASISNDGGFVCGSSVTNYSAFDVGTTTLHDEADTYTWSISNPAVGSISSGQGTAEVEVTWNNVQVLTNVHLILTMTRCSLPPVVVQKAITVQNIPEIVVVNPWNSSVCGSEEFTITIEAAQSGVVMNDSNTQILWTSAEGSFIGGLTASFVFENNTGDDITRNVSAQIFSYNGCEGTSNLLSFSVSVLPNPPATASYEGENMYCTAADIETLLTVSTNLTNVLYQWFKDGIPISGANSSTLQLNSQSGFGAYYCVVTVDLGNSTGCSNISNTVNIIQKSCEDPDLIDCVLTVNPVVSNTSSLTSCGTISLVGSSNGINESWSFSGPSEAVLDPITNTISGPPGMYVITLSATYLCDDDETYFNQRAIKEVVIPYEPGLVYEAHCSSTPNTYDIAFYALNSSFYPLLTNPQETFTYSTDGGLTWLPVIGNNLLIQAGSLILRVTNNGVLDGVPQITCWRDYEVNLVTIPNNFIEFDPPQNQLCNDTAVRFGFGNNINPDNFSFIWTFTIGSNTITNTLFNPAVVFTTPGTYNVSVAVSNLLGCTRTFSSTITIPPPCFGGTLVTTPPNATMCDGQSVKISYQPSLSNCTVLQYRWMRNQELIPNTLNSTFINVTEPGYYWLEVISPNNCKYVVPNRIYPRFRSLPSVKIVGETNFCVGDAIILKGVYSGNSVWSVNGTIVANNVTTITINNLGIGNHNVSLKVIDGAFCSKTVTHTISVSEAPSNVQITPQLLSCNPYTVQLTATATNATQFVWSNGATGNTTTISYGGLMGVIAKNGTCETAAQLQIPSHPQEYQWSYPTGCLDLCENNQGFVLGPIATLDHQEWHLNETTIAYINQGDSPEVQVPDSGSYHAIIYNGGCGTETPVLNIYKDRCTECNIRADKGVVSSVTINGLCAFQVTISFTNFGADPMQINLFDPLQNFVLTPSTFQIPPGASNVLLTLFPVNGFIPNTNYNFDIQGIVFDRNLVPTNCAFHFDLFLGECTADRVALNSSKEVFATSINYYPNPVLQTLTVSWPYNNQIDVISIYDLRGRRVLQTTVPKETLQKTLNLDSLTAGVYILMVENNETLVGQYKIVKQ